MNSFLSRQRQRIAAELTWVLVAALHQLQRVPCRVHVIIGTHTMWCRGMPSVWRCSTMSSYNIKPTQLPLNLELHRSLLPKDICAVKTKFTTETSTGFWTSLGLARLSPNKLFIRKCSLNAPPPKKKPSFLKLHWLEWDFEWRNLCHKEFLFSLKIIKKFYLGTKPNLGSLGCFIKSWFISAGSELFDGKSPPQWGICHLLESLYFTFIDPRQTRVYFK